MISFQISNSIYKLVRTRRQTGRQSIFSTKSYQSDGRTSSVAAEPRASNASRRKKYSLEETIWSLNIRNRRKAVFCFRSFRFQHLQSPFEPRASLRVLRSSRVKHLQSPQKPRTGNVSRPQDVISESRTRNRVSKPRC